jgi:predicted SAM-dependent methyltransferase
MALILERRKVMNPIKLNLGCANDIKEGYINVDLFHNDPRVKISDVRNLDFVESNTAEEVYAKDILEHITFTDGHEALKEWYRVLKPGGRLYVQTINFDLQVEAFQRGFWSLADYNYMLFAGPGWVDDYSRPQDFHKSVYTVSYMTKLLENLGFTIEESKTDRIDQQLMHMPRSHNLNMKIWARKQ